VHADATSWRGIAQAPAPFCTLAYASSAGRVANCGLEMSQNALRLSWRHADVDERLHVILKEIHANCVQHGKRADGSVNYVDGANIAGFMKMADSMLAQGLY
jgi:glutamate dehydrogenase (NADP+)